MIRSATLLRCVPTCTLRLPFKTFFLPQALSLLVLIIKRSHSNSLRPGPYSTSLAPSYPPASMRFGGRRRGGHRFPSTMRRRVTTVRICRSRGCPGSFGLTRCAPVQSAPSRALHFPRSPLSSILPLSPRRPTLVTRLLLSETPAGRGAGDGGGG